MKIILFLLITLNAFASDKDLLLLKRWLNPMVDYRLKSVFVANLPKPESSADSSLREVEVVLLKELENELKANQGHLRSSERTLYLEQLADTLQTDYRLGTGLESLDVVIELLHSRSQNRDSTLASQPDRINPLFKVKNPNIHLEALKQTITNRESHIQDVWENQINKIVDIHSELNSAESLKVLHRIKDKFFQVLDTLYLDQYEYFALHTLREVQNTFRGISKQTNPTQEAELIQIREEIIDAYEEMTKNQHLFGENQDVKRMNEFEKIHKLAKQFHAMALEISPVDKQNKVETNGATNSNKIANSIKRSIKTLKFLTTALRFVFKVPMATYTSEKLAGQNLATEIARLMGAMGGALGYEVSIKNKQVLEEVRADAKNNPKKVIILAPTHRSRAVDFAMMSTFLREKVYIFGKLVKYAPTNWLKKRTEKIPGLVNVGKKHNGDKRSSIDLMFSTIHNPDSPREILIFPEGGVPNILEFMPVRKNFDEKLVRRLIAEGFEVDIVPISFHNIDYIFNKPTTRTSEKLFSYVHAPIKHSEISKLLNEVHVPHSVNNLIRAKWMQAYDRFNNTKAAQVSSAELEQLIDDFTKAQTCREKFN